jgi:general secretion pathway protein H
MPTSAPGSRRRGPRRAAGFTLIEVMIVVAIVAIAVGLVTFSIRDPARTRLELEAARLSALLEQARTEARSGGYSVLWAPTAGADGGQFRFVGLPPAVALPTRWLDEHVSAQVVGAPALLLGPDAILPPQRVVLMLDEQRIEIATDGLGAFAVALPAGS